MCATQLRSSDPSGAAAAGNVAMNLEVVVIPVSDVDRAKSFYVTLGWRLDADVAAEGSRLVQVTPPGSGCSVQFGEQLTEAPPGSAQNLYLVVSDIDAARDDLSRGGVAVSEVFHCASGFRCRFRDAGMEGRVRGTAPDDTSYGSFASFNDPDGNGWLVQEVTTRLAGRVNPERTSYGSASELAGALRRAAAAHGEHERRTGAADADWPDWYADFMVREQAGAEAPT
jgi:catechol 2,3-dioxygenase-like lactoylglutathione lyase family enzyme